MEIEFTYFAQAWNFFKKFYDVQDNEQYWDAVVQEAGQIIENYNYPLCKAVILAIIDELDRKYKAKYKRKKGNSLENI